MASEENVRKILENKENLLKIFSEAIKAHDSSPTKLFHVKTRNSNWEVFSFPGSWELSDWYSKGPFGTTKINRELFPSLRSIGVGAAAIVNEAFQKKFESIDKAKLREKVDAAVKENKQIVFTGHSSGGPIAVLATIWLLEHLAKQNVQILPTPLCVTFGSPLVGDRIFSHALRRQDWARLFVHFVTRHDIIPRLFLAPLSSINQHLDQALNYIKPKSKQGSSRSANFFDIFMAVISNAMTLTSHVVAYKPMENQVLENITSFIELSPYRPFGNYVFIDENNKLVVLNNSEAVLHFLFYSCQPGDEGEAGEFAGKSLKCHLDYKAIMDRINQWQFYGGDGDLIQEVLDNAADAFGLSPRGRLCLLAAGESEKQKTNNLDKLNSKRGDMERVLRDVESYRKACEIRKVGYYDSFKLQKRHDDFKANMNRLELVGIWDEIVELLKAYQLPDQFEGLKEWIELGTKFRRLLEPIDIANYYRGLKQYDAGHYMDYGRPSRYKYTQKWLEHSHRVLEVPLSESNVLAVVEELIGVRTTIDDFGQRALEIQKKLIQWRREKVIEDDVFLSDSTFVKWWESLDSSNKDMEIQELIIARKTET